MDIEIVLQFVNEKPIDNDWLTIYYHIFLEAVPKCIGCNMMILDRFIFKVLDNTWHLKCLKCAHCNELLKEKCFVRERKVFCKSDFFRLNCNFFLKYWPFSIENHYFLIQIIRSKVWFLFNGNSSIRHCKASSGSAFFCLNLSKNITKDKIFSLPG